MKKFKSKEKAAFIVGLQKLIEEQLLTDTELELEQIYLALLGELQLKIYTKIVEVKKEYSISLTPAQAMALRLLCILKAKAVDPYMANRMLQLANAINKHFY